VKRALAFVVDAVLIVVFAAAGRRNHDEALMGVFTTAWPFLVGLIAGWVMGNVRGGDPFDWRFGGLLWGTTLFIGMGLRGITGQGTAVSFVVVAAGILALLLIGWRAAYGLRANRLPSA